MRAVSLESHRGPDVLQFGGNRTTDSPIPRSNQSMPLLRASVLSTPLFRRGVFALPFRLVSPGHRSLRSHPSRGGSRWETCTSAKATARSRSAMPSRWRYPLNGDSWIRDGYGHVRHQESDLEAVANRADLQRLPHLPACGGISVGLSVVKRIFDQGGVNDQKMGN